MFRFERAVVGAALAACLSLLAAGSASAATTLGQTGAGGAGTSGAGTFIQTATGAGVPSYAVPAGGGVITSWSFQAGSTAGEHDKLKVVRTTATANQFFVVGEGALETMTPNSLNTFLVRIPVQAGDLLGLFTDGNDSTVPTKTTGNADAYIPSADPSPGTTFTGTPESSSNPQEAYNVSATVEADADHDGFGDETQDKCPGVPGSVQGCPQADLSITKTASASGVFGGQSVSYTLTAKNNGPDAAPGVVVSDALPPGATLLSATPSSGTCSGATCSVGTLGNGATATVTVVAKMASGLGAKTDTATVDSPTLDQAAKNASGAGDTNPANNTASATTTVSAPTFVGASLGSGTLTVKNGNVTITVTSPSSASGTLSLTDVINSATGKVVSAKKRKRGSRKTITLGRASFSIAAGQTERVTIHLSGQALKLLGKDKSMKATLTAVTTDLFGTQTTTKSKVTLKPAKTKKHHKKH